MAPVHPFRRCVAAFAFVCLLAAPQTARAVLVGVYDPDAGSFTVQLTLNDLVGATALYNQGVLGQNAVVANIEAGFVGTDNDPLGSQPIIRLPTASDGAGVVEHHATMTGHVLAARGSFTGSGSYYLWELGLAPMATFYSGAIATEISENGDFDLSEKSFFTPYYHAMKGWSSSGIDYVAADVINSSWGDSALNNGSDLMALSLDALIYETKKMVVVSAGNDGPTGQVGSPASAMNTITVGALGGPADALPYTTIAEFSSGGPNDYFLPSNAAGTEGITITGARASVDIVAPGEGFVLAYDGATDIAYVNAAGTSFAAPTVAGGLALMVDAARQLSAQTYVVSTGDTLHVGARLSDKLIDARTMKAILLTSANRNLPGWDNGQTAVDADGRTIIRTTQALDWRLGAGAANFSNALNIITSVSAHNFTSDGNRIVEPVGNSFSVGAAGWDFNTLSFSSNDLFTYEIETLLQATNVFAVSLVWFTEAGYQATLGTGNQDVSLESATFGSFMDLNLKVYLKAAGDELYALYAESVSLYNTVEFLQFELPYDAYLRFEVVIDGTVYNFTDADLVDYGIAWQTTAIPEPATCVILLGASALMFAIIRRRGCNRRAQD
ncbi:MAG: glycosyltransferase family 1 [Rariglobus sp.]|jgi:hypothetical protein|nr:glycosyltransferase family 1 [Rariglobus sp.]